MVAPLDLTPFQLRYSCKIRTDCIAGIQIFSRIIMWRDMQCEIRVQAVRMVDRNFEYPIEIGETIIDYVNSKSTQHCKTPTNSLSTSKL